ncbi:MAG: alpha-amylase family glycosyl hydrolase [Candidatus Binataceae bacterium]
MASVWWRRAVFYQIYPRSFADSNGDGIGDLDGITAHLDYLNDGSARSLGIDALWLSPINPSPLKDWGYDVSDYRGVHPELGDLASFDRLIAQAHRRDIRIILDLVPNHTSDQHQWFREARSSRTNPKRDWYIWKAGAPDRPPNNWVSIFGGPAWKYDDVTCEWYLHLFLESQPDLNFRNPEVVEAMQNVMRFWLDRGTDGFRVDVIHGMIKDAQFRDNPPLLKPDPGAMTDVALKQQHLYDVDQPEVHEVVRGFRRVLEEYGGDRILVGEVWPRDNLSLADYLRPDELQQAFNFRFLFCPWKAASFRAQVGQVEQVFPHGSWPTYTLSNHDFPRHLTRYAGGAWTAARARLAAVMILGLRGTPFLYYGEELGMPNVEIPKSEWRDPVGRDGCRTPMQWSGAPHGGFTSGQPWLRCGDYTAINAARQTGDASSMLSFYRRMIRVRRDTPALHSGDLKILDSPGDSFVFARQLGKGRAIVALNFASEALAIGVPQANILISSDPARASGSIAGRLRLAPLEAIVLALESA